MEETVTVTIELDDAHPIEHSILRIEGALETASDDCKSHENRKAISAACRVLNGWRNSLICLK